MTDKLPYHRAWLLAILVVALGLRMPGYFESVWIDELYTSNLFCGDFVVLLKTLYSDIHPPLYFVFMHGWNVVFGDAEVWLRLPPLLSGLASIVLVHAIGKTWFGVETGLAAAALLAVSPVHVWYSQEARPYATNVMLFLLAVLAFVRLGGGRHARLWTLAFFAGVFGAVFTHYYMAAFLFVFPALAIVRPHPARRRITVCCAIVLALLGVYMGAKTFFSHVPTSKGYLRPFDLGELVALCFNWFPTGGSLSPRGVTDSNLATALAFVQVAVALALARGVWRAARGAAWPLPLLTGALPCFLLALPWLGMPLTYIERSALPSLPLWVILVAAGITGCKRYVTVVAVRGAAAFAAAGVLAAFLVFSQEGRWTVYKPNPDWRGAAAWLADDIRGDTRYEMLADYPSPTALTYYDARFQEAKNFVRNDAKLDKLVTKSEQVFGLGAITRWIRARFDEYEHKLEAKRRATRVRIHELKPDTVLPDSAAPIYLLVHGTQSARIDAILADPALRVIAKRDWLMLRCYKLARRP